MGFRLEVSVDFRSSALSPGVQLGHFASAPWLGAIKNFFGLFCCCSIEIYSYFPSFLFTSPHPRTHYHGLILEPHSSVVYTSHNTHTHTELRNNEVSGKLLLSPQLLHVCDVFAHSLSGPLPSLLCGMIPLSTRDSSLSSHCEMQIPRGLGQKIHFIHLLPRNCGH